jgi:hypothetical protein
MIKRRGVQNQNKMETDVAVEPPPSKKARWQPMHFIFSKHWNGISQQKEIAKQLWLLTYGSSCASITQLILAPCGLIVEECYTAEWRESKYTLIRLSREHHIRRNALMAKMLELKDVHGIIGTEIFGFESVSCNSQTLDESLFAHPGFKIIVETMNKDISKLESWMRDGNITNNRKGLLWKFMNGTNPDQMTRSQLIQKVKEWGPSIKEYDELKHTHAILLARLSETEAAYTLSKSQYETEKKLNEEFMTKLKDKIKECGELQRELIKFRQSWINSCGFYILSDCPPRVAGLRLPTLSGWYSTAHSKWLTFNHPL